MVFIQHSVLEKFVLLVTDQRIARKPINELDVDERTTDSTEHSRFARLSLIQHDLRHRETRPRRTPGSHAREIPPHVSAPFSMRMRN